MALSPDDTQGIIEALMDTEPMQWVISQMKESAPSVTGEEEPPPDYMADDDLGELGGDDLGGLGDDPDVGLGDGMGDDNDHDSYMCDDDDKEVMAKYMSGEMDEEEIMGYMSTKRKRNRRKHYDAEDNGPDSSSEGFPGTDPAKFSKLRNDFRRQVRKYSRLEQEHKKLRDRVEKAEQQRRQAERYSKLTDLKMEYALELDKELERTKSMSDEQFEDHLDVITENYARIPLADRTPVLPTPPLKLHEGKEVDEKTAAKAQKYCMQERDKGNNVSFAEALDHVLESA